jgi:Tfp pilus assembly protein PilF
VQGETDRAQQLYEQAIATREAGPDVYNNYGVLLFKRGNANDAIRMYRRAVAIDPTHVRAWVNLGVALDEIGIHAEATGAFDRALKLDPDNVQVKISLARQYMAIGVEAEARKLFEELARSAPKEPLVHYHYAQFLEAQKDTVGAVREFDLFFIMAGTTFDAESMKQVRAHVAALKARP